MNGKAEAEDFENIYPNAANSEDEFDNSMLFNGRAPTPSMSTGTTPSRPTYSRVSGGDVNSRDLSMGASISRPTDNVFNRQSSYVNAFGNRAALVVDNRDTIQTVESLKEFIPDRGFVYKLEGGHTSGVSAIYVHHATERTPPMVLTGGDDKTVVVWNLHTGELVRKLDGGHSKVVTSIAVYAPDSGSAHVQVVTGSRDATAVVWDVETGKIIHKLKGGHGVSEVSSVVVFASANITVPPLIVTGGWDNDAVVWDLLTGQQLYRLEGGHTEGITSMALYNPTDGAPPLVVTGGADNIATVWNLTTGAIVRQLKGGHMDRIFAVVVHAPRGVCPPLVITGSEDTTATVWDLLSGAQLSKLEGGHTGRVSALAIYSPPDGISSPLVLTASEDKTAVLWNLSTSEQIRRLSGCHSGPLHAAGVYAPKRGRGTPLFLTGGQDKVAVVWDLWSSEQVRKLEGGHDKPVKAVAVYTPPSSSIPAVVITAGDERSAVVWDLQSQQVMHRLSGGHSGEVTSVVIYTPPGVKASPVAVTGSEDRTAVVWDVFTGQQLHKLKGGHTDWITCLAVYESADRLSSPLVVTGSYDKCAAIWELASGKLVRKLAVEHTAAVTAVAVFVPAVDSYATPLVLTGSDDCSIIVWDLESGQVVRKLQGHQGGITSLLVYASTDITVQVISTAREKAAIVWDLTSGRVVRKLEGGHAEWISSAAVYVPLAARSSALVATAGNEASIVVWELSSGRIIRKLEGVHKRLISQLVVYEPKDLQQPPMIISASHDNTAALWKNALLPFEFMPLMDEVLRLFRADVASFPTDAEPWSRIESIIARHGDGFWFENHSLFRAALTDVKECSVRDSFFAKYKSAMFRVVHLVPLIVTGKQAKCILQNAVERKLRHRHTIFDAWLHVLNSHDGDFLWQVFHPSLFLRRPALLALSDIYPAEFIDFICKLKFVRASPLLHKNCNSYHIDNFSSMVIEGFSSEVTVDMWTKVAGYRSDVNNTSAQPVTAYILPLAAPADMKLLQAYVDVSDACDDLAIFNSDVGSVAFRYAWRSFGKDAHINAMLFYSAFLAVFTCSVVTFDRLYQSGHAWGPVLAWILQALVLRFVIKYIADEVRQCYNDYSIRKRRNDERMHSVQSVTQQPVTAETTHLKPGQHRQAYLNTSKRFRWLRKACSHTEQYLRSFTVVKIGKIILRHFTDFWNQLDLAVVLMVLLGTLLRCCYGRETDKSRSVLALGCVLVWFKLLYFMRPFKGSGPLVTMILRIMSDIKYFLFILAVVLTGFALAFWMISYPDDKLPFGTIPMAFINTFLYMLGQEISADFGHTASPNLGVFLLVLFMLFMMILMLNLLIALMGSTFKAVQNKGLAQWRLEQASMMLEQRFTLTEAVLRRHRHFSRVHVLKTTALIDKARKETLRDGEKIIRRESAAGRKDGNQGAVLALLDAKLQSLGATLEARTDRKAQLARDHAATQLQDLVARQTAVDSKLHSLEDKLDSLLNKMSQKDSSKFAGILNPFAAAAGSKDHA